MLTEKLAASAKAGAQQFCEGLDTAWDDTTIAAAVKQAH